jgi:hypothetical protein
MDVWRFSPRLCRWVHPSVSSVLSLFDFFRLVFFDLRDGGGPPFELSFLRKGPFPAQNYFNLIQRFAAKFFVLSISASVLMHSSPI